MANPMPSSVQLNQAFGGKGSLTQTQDVAKAQMDQERAGRLMREAQAQDNCRISFNITATFIASDSGAATQTGWLDFGSMRFQGDIFVATGSMRLGQSGEPALANDKTGFDPTTNLCVPGDAMVLAYRTDANGLINGAKLLLVAMGNVPDGYQVQISVSFFGTAFRGGTA